METTVLNILATANPATTSIRYQTSNGTNWMIVPVVALVEGVLHSANAANAELALATEFGRHPGGWDGRPLVMNHPKIGGDYISANSSIQVLEEWSFGMLFNTQLDGNKLKTEAWIDLDKVNQAGGEMKSTVERLQAGKMVEISTGLSASVEQLHGEFQGQRYHGIWRNVVPDHLAFLSEGTLGACSVEGGCGAPRINELRHTRFMASAKPVTSEPDADSPPSVHAAADGCSCGCGGDCSTKGGKAMSEPTPHEVLNLAGKSQEQILEKMNSGIGVLANAYPSDMPIENVSKLLRSGLAKAGVDIFRIHTFTQDNVVYETWDSNKVFQRSFSISGDNQITINDDESEVMIMTKLVPAESASEEVDEKGSTEPGETATQQENSMSNNEKGSATQTETPKTKANEDGNENATSQSTEEIQATGENPTPEAPVETQEATQQVNQEKKPVTVNEYVNSAPPEIREMLSEGLKLHQQKKVKMIEEIKANKANGFNDEELRAMSMDSLEKLHKLAKTVPIGNYGGRAAPTMNSGQDDQNTVPRPLEAFPLKKTEQSA